MRYEINLTYSKSLIRYAVLRFWWRALGVGFILGITLLSVALTGLLLSGGTSWFVGVLGTLLGMALIGAATLYFVHYRNSLGKLRAMGNPSAKLVATDTVLSLSSGAGSSTLPWSSVQEVWQFPKCWLLLFSKAQFVTLPLDSVTSEVRAFILQQVRVAGGKTGSRLPKA
jgi:hypothetical protein